MLFNRIFYGRTLDRTGAGGETCLTRALKMNDAESVGAFLALGADPDGKNAAGEYPVHVALEKRNFEAARLLLEMGADFLITKDGLGLGEYARRNGLPLVADAVFKRETALRKAKDDTSGIFTKKNRKPQPGPG